MLRLHDLTLSRLAHRQERTPLTDAAWNILRAGGVRVVSVHELPASPHAARLDVRLEGPPSADADHRARWLLARFCGGEPGWRLRSDALALELPLGAPPDELELLGVGHREDSYTSLLAQAFRHHAGFRSRWLAALGFEASPSDWTCRVRPAVRTGMDASREKAGATSRRVPDLVLYSVAARALCVVENKVLAAEGYGQLEAYSEEAFLRELSRDCGVEPTQVKLTYLTLEGDRPEVAGAGMKFVPMPYESLAAALPDDDPSPLGRLLATLGRRIVERTEWPAPHDSAYATSFLNVHWGLVTPKQVFRRLARTVAPLDALTELRTGDSNNPNGPVLYAQFFKPTWEPPASEPPASPGWSVHFELQWAPVLERLILHLHHETRPFFTRNDLQRRPTFAATHKSQGDRLARQIQRAKAELGDGWQVRRYAWSHASCELSRELTVGQLRERLRALVAPMVDVVDRAVQGMESVA